MNISQRDSFWETVYDKACKDKDVIIISADMGAPALDAIRKDLPSQFVNTGIAEQNTITLAAGLAINGKKVLTYAIAPFITLRCLEMIRVENAIMNIPITIVGVGAGYSYEDSGPTHHLIEDIAIMRAMPNIYINSITDSVMARYFADISCSKKNYTNYVRLDRSIYQDIYSSNHDFKKGVCLLREGTDCLILTTGTMAHVALEVSELFEREGFSVGVIDIFQIPINEANLIGYISNVDNIVTLEEHFISGGIGSAVAEIICDHNLCKQLKRIGISMNEGYCYVYGGRDIIRKHLKIDANNVYLKIKEILSSDK